MTTAIARIARLLLLLLLCERATSLIIPEELPTILSLIYSNIPPIKKGTDSRLGLGFRLGEHADFQILIELGPQTETDPIGINDAKKRRNAMLGAAMRGDLGPLAQAVAKYQMERRLQQEMERLKALEEKLKEMREKNKSEEQEAVSGGDWLTKWRQQVSRSPDENVPSSSAPSEDDETIRRRIEKPSVKFGAPKDKVERLTKLYESRDADDGEKKQLRR